MYLIWVFRLTDWKKYSTRRRGWSLFCTKTWNKALVDRVLGCSYPKLPTSQGMSLLICDMHIINKHQVYSNKNKLFITLNQLFTLRTMIKKFVYIILNQNYNNSVIMSFWSIQWALTVIWQHDKKEMTLQLIFSFSQI